MNHSITHAPLAAEHPSLPILLIAVKGDVDAKIVENEKAISAAFAEKENLCARNVKASEELGVLNRQLRLLSSALADAKRRLDREK